MLRKKMVNKTARKCKVFRQLSYKLIASLLILIFAPTNMARAATAENTVLIGHTNKTELHQKFATFADDYLTYQPSHDEITAVAKLPSHLRLTVYFGTWCHDSVREVPKLLKIFAQQKQQIELIALDMSKSDPQGLAQKQQVKYTPTIIVYLGNTEIGRIVESPKNSISADILAFWQAARE